MLQGGEGFTEGDGFGRDATGPAGHVLGDTRGGMGMVESGAHSGKVNRDQ